MNAKTRLQPASITDARNVKAWRQLQHIVASLNNQNTDLNRFAYEEMRGSERTSCSIPVKLTWYQPYATGRGITRAGPLHALARNISPTGIGIIVRRMFHAEDQVFAEIASATGVWHLQCRVAFCRHLQGLFHEVGLQFIGVAPDSSCEV